MFSIYLEVARYLQNALPELRWIDLYKGQLEVPENYNAPILPTVYVDLPSITWKDTVKHSQSGDTTTLRLIVLVRLPAETHVTDPMLADNVTALELADRVHAAFVEMPGVVSRNASQLYPHRLNDVDIFVTELTYSARFTYQHAPYVRPAQDIPPGITATITPNLNDA